MKKIGIFVLMIVLLGMVSPVSARTSQDALYVGVPEIAGSGVVAQDTLPAIAREWRTSWLAREHFINTLISSPAISFVYKARKEQKTSSEKNSDSVYVDTLTYFFNGWLYQDDEKGFDYILMFPEDLEKLYSTCTVGIVDMVTYGYFISSKTFTVQSGVKKGMVLEIQQFVKRGVERKGRKYVLLTLPRATPENKK